jgi:hypothetical protein
MDDRSIPVARWTVVRLCESSRHQSQLLAQAYQQVFPQVRQPLGSVNVAAAGGDAAAGGGSAPQRPAAARVAAGA